MFFYHSRMGDILLLYHVLPTLYDIPHAQRWNPHVFPSKRTVNDHFAVVIFLGVRNVADSTAISCCSKPTISKTDVNFWFQKISHPKVRGLKLPGKVLAVLQLLSLQHWIAPRNAVLGRLPSQWIADFFRPSKVESVNPSSHWCRDNFLCHQIRIVTHFAVWPGTGLPFGRVAISSITSKFRSSG